MKALIKKCDFLSYKVSLTLNRKGETGYKTFFGGIISLISLFISMFFSLYFLNKMITRKDFIITKSTEYNPNLNLSYSYKLPFLLRLTDNNSIPFNEEEKLFHISASIVFGGSDKNILLKDEKENSKSLRFEKCDINQHFFEEFRKYFINFPNLNTYYCLKKRDYTENIYGIYKNSNPFSYYSFNLNYCYNSIENNNTCYSISDIKNKINNLFLDIVFVDYSFDLLNKKSFKEVFIRKERIELSLILFKRISLFLKNIKFITDEGFIFQNKKIENFHSYKSIKIDSNIYEENPILGNILILNDMKSSIYNKNYFKIQNYLSNIGGFIHIFTLFSSIFNYFNSENSYYIKLIKYFVIENKILNNNNISKTKILSKNVTSTIFYKTKSNIDYLQKNESGIIIIPKKENIHKIETSFKSMKSSFLIRFLPSIFINKKNKHTLLMYKNFINSRLNVINILKKLEMIQINNDSIRKSINGVSQNNNSLKPIVSKINNYVSEINNNI